MGKGKGGYKGKGGFKGNGDKGGREEANRTMTVKGIQYSTGAALTAGSMGTHPNSAHTPEAKENRRERDSLEKGKERAINKEWTGDQRGRAKGKARE